jgi:cell wall-associated NlpC family hydrolase
MKIFKILCFLCSILIFTASCSTSAKYGIRSEKYSRERVNNKRDIVYKETENKKSRETKSVLKADVKSEKSTAKPSTTSSMSAVEKNKREDVLKEAEKHIGTPYKYSGKTPEGFDCSGFTNYVFNQNDLKISGPSHELAMMGVYKDQNELKPGDLVFFGGDNKISHVGIVKENTVEKTYFIHSSTSAGIKIDEINSSDYWRSRYLFGRDLISELLIPKYSSSKSKF